MPEKLPLKYNIRDRFLLYLSGFLQVIFVTSSTYQISNQMYMGATFTGFMISLIWSYNVRRIAFSDTIDRYLYAAGAATGSYAGIFITKYVYQLLTTYNIL